MRREHDEVWRERWLAGSVETGEFPQFTPPRPRIQPFDVAPFADVERRVHEHFDEAIASDESTGVFSRLPVWTNQRAITIVPSSTIVRARWATSRT
jgi:hypothetical protein